MPGTYPALYTVTVTDGTSHSTEAMVTVGGNGKVSDVILYANGYRECKYLLTDADSDAEYFWLLTSSGDKVTDPGTYTAINMCMEEEDGFEGVFVTVRYISTVTINEYGVVSAISISSDDTDDNKYVYTETYMEGYGTTEESFTDLDGNEVTEDGLYIATFQCKELYYSGYDFSLTCDLTGFISVKDGEIWDYDFVLI